MKSNNKRFTFLIVLLVLSIVLIAGTTYALFTKSVSSAKILSIQSGTKYIGLYGDEKENIILNKAYEFSIENRGLENASYNLYLEDISNTIGKSNIIYSYGKNGVNKTGMLTDAVIDTANLKPGESVLVSIRLTSIVPGEYQGKLKIDTKSATEDSSGANKPVLVGDMIPVVYDMKTSSWVKADPNSVWYNYDAQEWANAVTILDASSRVRYMASDVGTKIDINDINTMWVWVPRYSYALKSQYGVKFDGAQDLSVNTPGAFDIKFVDKTVVENGSGVYTGDVVSNYYTPSAFCYGDMCDVNRSDTSNVELPGVWVSKFELTGTLDSLSSIPNANSLRNNDIKSLFTAISQNFSSDNGSAKYGLAGNYDTHMIKNTEWGVLAYLSQSKYGKYGNLSYTDLEKEIFINNYYDETNKVTVTGCSAGSSLSAISNKCSYTYDTLVYGVGASTTGNIYGVYDTVGGAYEFVMGNYNNVLLNSGFTSMPSVRYYNSYTGAVGIKGDATTEVMNFYGDNALFISDAGPWFVRGSVAGGGNDALSGIFSFTAHTGLADESISTRMSMVTW